MQSVMLMACKFQWDNEADLATSMAPGGRGKCWGYRHIPTVMPILHGVRPFCGAAGDPQAWIHVSPSESLARGFPEEGDCSLDLPCLLQANW